MTPLKEGDKAPYFEGINQDGKKITLDDFKGKKFMFTFILAVMMIPTQVTALGFLQLLGKIGLDDSFVPLIVPSIAAPVTFFYMKQYMESALPLSLIEAARIDGSGEFHTFNQIVLPLMKPAIAVQAIFTFVSSWNNYFTPALILHDDKKKTPLPEQHVTPDEVNEAVTKLRSLCFNVGLVASEICTDDTGSQYFIVSVSPSMHSVATTSDGRIYIRVADKCEPVRSEDLQRKARPER